MKAGWRLVRADAKTVLHSRAPAGLLMAVWLLALLWAAFFPPTTTANNPQSTTTQTVTATPTATPTTTATPPSTGPVQFTQLNWLADDGSVRFADSRVGVAEFSFSSDATQLLATHGGGFVNVVTDIGSGPQWSVQNLYLNYPSPGALRHAHPSVQFGFPTSNGTPVTTLDYGITITKNARTQPPASLDFHAVVNLRDYLVGGLGQGGSGRSNFPLNVGVWVGCANVRNCKPNLNVKGEVQVQVDKLPAVNEGKMGCAPGAAARSIKYLMGAAVGDVQSIYSDLYGDMGTSPTTGTTKPNILSGKRQYTKDNKLKINSTMSPWSKSQAKNYANELNKGADLEIIIQWDNQTIGHVAMVTSITEVGKDQFQIKYVDDPTQGDGKAENQEHTITVGADGSFAGGKITDFLLETKRS
jgi:hypothetical protein